MKSPLLIWTVGFSLVSSGGLARADLATTGSGTLNQPIPDGDLTGLASILTVATGATIASNLSVNVSLTPGNVGGFAGDLYLTLEHNGAFVTLLNRPGRSASKPSGYSDGQPINLTFTLGAVSDVHLYRTVLDPMDDANPLAAGPLSGVWQPDGRATSPISVVDTDPRTTSLASLAAQDPNGVGVLFAADLSGGGQYQLNQWSLSFADNPAISTNGPAQLTLGNLDTGYDGSPKPVTWATVPPGLPVIVTYNGSTNPPTDIGSYTVVATVSGDSSHAPGTSGPFTYQIVASLPSNSEVPFVPIWALATATLGLLGTGIRRLK